MKLTAKSTKAIKVQNYKKKPANNCICFSLVAVTKYSQRDINWKDSIVTLRLISRLSHLLLL